MGHVRPEVASQIHGQFVLLHHAMYFEARACQLIWRIPCTISQQVFCGASLDPGMFPTVNARVKGWASVWTCCML